MPTTSHATHLSADAGGTDDGVLGVGLAGHHNGDAGEEPAQLGSIHLLGAHRVHIHLARSALGFQNVWEAQHNRMESNASATQGEEKTATGWKNKHYMSDDTS